MDQSDLFPWPDLAGRLVGEGHRLPVRVYYEDTDFSGVVYHAAYLKFLERGRTDFLRLRDISHAALCEAGLAFAVRRMTLDFAKAARIDDALLVETRVAALRGASIVLDQWVRRGETVLVGAEVTVALIDRDGRPRRLTPAILDGLGRAGRAALST